MIRILGVLPPIADFQLLLPLTLGSRGLSLRAFARMSGLPVSLLSRIKSGERAVPVARIEAWADLLDLQGESRATFVDSAMWTSVPERIRPWLKSKLGY